MGRYDDIAYIGDGRFVIARRSGSDWRVGVTNVRGEEVISFGRFSEDDFHVTFDGNFVGREGRTFYVLDDRGRTIASFDQYDNLVYVTNNRFIVSTGWGSSQRSALIDARGNEIISMGRYHRIEAFEGGSWFLVEDNGRFGLLDARGNEVISVAL
jgi:hypothetical protein